MSRLRLLVARTIMWVMDDLCEACHHFNLLPSGWPGCIMMWPVCRRLAAWAFEELYPL